MCDIAYVSCIAFPDALDGVNARVSLVDGHFLRFSSCNFHTVCTLHHPSRRRVFGSGALRHAKPWAAAVFPRGEADEAAFGYRYEAGGCGARFGGVSGASSQAQSQSSSSSSFAVVPLWF